MWGLGGANDFDVDISSTLIMHSHTPSIQTGENTDTLTAIAIASVQETQRMLNWVDAAASLFRPTIDLCSVQRPCMSLLL